MSINYESAVVFKGGLFKKMLGKQGWYIVIGNIKEGPFLTRKKAEEVSFFDRYYC